MGSQDKRSIYGWGAQGLFPDLPTTLHVPSEIIEYMIELGIKSRTITLNKGCVISGDVAGIKANPWCDTLFSWHSSEVRKSCSQWDWAFHFVFWVCCNQLYDFGQVV